MTVRQDWYRLVPDEGVWRPTLSLVDVPWRGTGPTPEPEPEPEPEPDPDQPSPDVQHGTDLQRQMVGLEGAGVDPATLTASGPIVTSSDGQVIENLHVDATGSDGTFGAITVRHNNVRIRNCLVSHRQGRNGIRIDGNASGTRVEYCHLHGRYRTAPTGNTGSIGVLVNGPNATVLRCVFQGGRDGIHLRGVGSRAFENWVIDLHFMGSVHNDSVVLLGRAGSSDIEVARNRALAGNSGGIDAYSWQGPNIDVRFFNNLIVGVGLGFGIYGGFEQPVGGLPNYHHDNRNFRIEGNRFEGTFRFPDTLGEGSNAATNLSQPGNTFVNNRWLEGWGDHTVDLPARCGVRQDACESDWTTGT